MRISECLKCEGFPCEDVEHRCFILPEIEVTTQRVSLVMISEAAPQNGLDYYYTGNNALFKETTLLAFKDAGVTASTIQDLLDRGIYFTTAVKCGKTGYGLKAATIRQCSLLLEQELSFFSNLKVIMLMGDVAIKALNYMVKRVGEPRVIPAGSTYKIRNGEFYFRDIRMFPSYLQAGPSFFIEKSKRRMIAEDIREAMKLIA